MAQRRLYNRLSGLDPLSYVGVEALTPPDLIIDTRAPTTNDIQFNLGTFWLVDTNPNFELWQLASLDNDIATWIQLYPAGGGGGGASTFPTDSGIATQLAGILNVFGANAITQTAGAGNTVTISLVNGTDGQLIIGGGAFPAWANLTSLGGTITISNGPNSINLEAASTGTVVNLQGDSGPVVPPDASGTINVLGANGLSTDGNAGTNTLTITTANGQPLLQSLTGNSGTVFPDGSQNINVVGTGVVSVTGSPGTNTLTIATSGAVASSFPTDAGTAVPAAGALTMAGGTLIGTTGAGSTVTINLDNGTDGQVIIGATAGSPAYANITSLGGTITITNGANSINLEAAGAPISSGASVLAYLSATSVNATGNGTVVTVIADTEVFDTGNDYNNATGVFTAPVTSRYLIECMIGYISSTAESGHNRIVNSIVTSNRTFTLFYSGNSFLTIANRRYTVNQSVIADMDIGDTCTITASVGTAPFTQTISLPGDPTTVLTSVNFRQMG